MFNVLIVQFIAIMKSSLYKLNTKSRRERPGSYVYRARIGEANVIDFPPMGMDINYNQIKTNPVGGTGIRMLANAMAAKPAPVFHSSVTFIAINPLSSTGAFVATPAYPTLMLMRRKQ